MSRRRSAGSQGLVVAVVVLLAALLLVRLLGWLLLAGFVAAGVVLWRRRFGRQAGRPVAVSLEQRRLARQLADVTRERDQFGAEVAELRGQLAEARESAHAAWDAASSAAPRLRVAESGGVAEHLAAQPFSGARRL